MQDTLFTNVKYLPINEKDEAWGLTITTAGFQSILPHTSYPPKGHPSQYWFNPSSGRILHEFQLIYITKGEGVFKSGYSKKPIPLEAGTLIVLFPNEWHSYCPKETTGWDTYWVGFKGYFANNLIHHNFFRKTESVFNVGFNEQIVDLFSRSIDIAKQEKPGFQPIISGIAMHLLGLIYYTTRNELFDDKEIVIKIEKARMMMREYPEVNACPEEIASALNMSYSWFRRMFKQYTGLSPAQYQLQVKLQKAKALLISSSKSVKEIAYLLEFESPNYFTCFFKEKTGYSPLNYRKISHGRSKI